MTHPRTVVNDGEVRWSVETKKLARALVAAHWTVSLGTLREPGDPVDDYTDLCSALASSCTIMSSSSAATIEDGAETMEYAPERQGWIISAGLGDAIAEEEEVPK